MASEIPRGSARLELAADWGSFSVAEPMPDIVLSTFNAKYIHAAFGLRYLFANLGELQSRATMLEFDINQRATDIVECLLEQQPRIIGIGVYIWNATLALEVVTLLKRVAPQVIVILGGPEVSYECEAQAVVQAADYVITGEADLKFAQVCEGLLSGSAPASRVIPAELPDLGRVILPYDFYDAHDVATRIVYVEASRGCPFTCEFCLSSLDIPVRAFPLSAFLEAMGRLLERGVQHFKFVDRTFNLNLHTSRAILEFFLERRRPGLFLHFEMIPDRLPESLRALIAQFEPGTLQFEVGIQTFDLEVAERIKRRQDLAKLADNFKFLREQTGVHIHADLIAGLPGESVAGFGRGFDRLVGLGPQEIQVGILKRLRGTPIARHDADWGMIYSPMPPYEILGNKLVSFPEVQRLRRFARYWDLVANSGNFLETAPLIWADRPSPFESFLNWSDWLYGQVGRRHGIALSALAERLFEYLTTEKKLEPHRVAELIWRDYQRGGRSDRPAFLQPYVEEASGVKAGPETSSAARRQKRRLNTNAATAVRAS